MGELLACRRRGKRVRNQREIFDYEAIASLPQLCSETEKQRQRQRQLKKRNRYQYQHRHRRSIGCVHTPTRCSIDIKNKNEGELKRKLFNNENPHSSSEINQYSETLPKECVTLPVRIVAKKEPSNKNEIPSEEKRVRDHALSVPVPEQLKKRPRGRPRKNSEKTESDTGTADEKLKLRVLSKLDVKKQKRPRGRPRKNPLKGVKNSIIYPSAEQEFGFGCSGTDVDASSICTASTNSRKPNKRESKLFPSWIDKEYVDTISISSRKATVKHAGTGAGTGRESKNIIWSSSFLDRSLDCNGNRFVSAYDVLNSDLSLFDAIGDTLSEFEMGMEWLTEII